MVGIVTLQHKNYCGTSKRNLPLESGTQWIIIKLNKQNSGKSQQFPQLILDTPHKQTHDDFFSEMLI